MPCGHLFNRIATAITLLAVANLANAVDLVAVQSQVFTPSCALSGCHNGAISPNLTAGQSFSSIVNVRSGQSTFDYIEPGSPADSYLVAKIEGTGFFSRMPLTGFLSTSRIQLVRDWVTGGALENEVTPPDPDPDPVDACSDVNAIAPNESTSSLGLETRLIMANPGSNRNQQTFLRFVNPNDSSASVEVYGIDDSGGRNKKGPFSFTLAAQASIQINAQDIEDGNTDKGPTSNLCDGQGKWQFRVRSDQAIKVIGLIRTPDGFLTSINDVVPKSGNDNIVYFVNPASNTRQQTFLRVANLSASTGAVSITGIDDAGVASSGGVTFTLGANESKQITAQDLENGNASKGLSGTLDNGSGKWRLAVTSSLNLEVISMIRTPDGFLTNLSGMVDANAAGDRVIYFANPASEETKTTFLRIINTSNEIASMSISGIDDLGNVAPEGDVIFNLGPNESKQMTAQDLESGNLGKGLLGSLGDGEGRWRLTVRANTTFQVMSLIRTPDGFLTNLSRTTPVSGGLNDVFIFNPGSNANQRSSLRIVNNSNQQGSVTISGIDDNGTAAPGGVVTFNIAPNNAMTVTAQDLENGNAGLGLVGTLGDGSGKWHLKVTSDVDLQVQSLLDTPTGFLTNLSRAAEIEVIGTSATAFFTANISASPIQNKCIACHIENGVAAASALTYTPSSVSGHEDTNFQLLQSYVGQDQNRGNEILQKVRGVDHGGGVQLSTDSRDYQNLVTFLGLLGAVISGGNNTPLGDFWQGVSLASPAQTLRRASLIVAGRLPTDAEIAAVKPADDTALRQSIRNLMTGDNFHNFLTTGANDRLFTDAFFNGLFFEASDIYAGSFFPIGANKQFNDRPTKQSQENAKELWLRQWYWGLIRAPLELIAYIVMNDRSYQEVVTADYMMVNVTTSEILNSGLVFDTNDHKIYQPGRNQGQIVPDDQLISTFDFEFGTNVTSHSGYIDYPHAGVLNTHAFLNRYPTTETNRNRARARWTYFHFLGLDIEKSAQRTTDPVALADMNNPTLNNPACTVCHSIHDPVAGTFQNYGNIGFYRDQGGRDSLPETYKYPRWFDENAEPSEYQEGDTWFRDMRTPGYEGQIAPNPDNSLAWAAAQIAEDPRFATAAVKFWWPALMGANHLLAPETSADSNFQQLLEAFEEQNGFIEDLGAQFATGINGGSPFNGKDLLTEMMMSPWFRATRSADSNSNGTAASVQDYGANRLLTPRELELKSREILGWVWGENEEIHQYDGVFTRLVDQYGIYYGGIDSNGIKERSRALTPLMANVAEKQAISMACPAVVVDFNRPDSERLLFGGIDNSTTPATEFTATFEVTPARFAARQTYSVGGDLGVSGKTISLYFENDYYEEDTGNDRNLRLDSLTVVDGAGVQVLHLELENLDQFPGSTIGCGAPDWNPDTQAVDDFNLFSQCTLTVPFAPALADTYTINVVAWGQQAGPEAPRLRVSVDDNEPANGTSFGAFAITNKLIDLHQKLLGESLEPGDEELEASYQLLLETWQARSANPDNFWAWSSPDETCHFYLTEHFEPDGVANNAQDPSRMLNTWASVLIYLMTDFHYLHE